MLPTPPANMPLKSMLYTVVNLIRITIAFNKWLITILFHIVTVFTKVDISWKHRYDVGVIHTGTIQHIPPESDMPRLRRRKLRSLKSETIHGETNDNDRSVNAKTRISINPGCPSTWPRKGTRHAFAGHGRNSRDKRLETKQTQGKFLVGADTKSKQSHVDMIRNNVIKAKRSPAVVAAAASRTETVQHTYFVSQEHEHRLLGKNVSIHLVRRGNRKC